MWHGKLQSKIKVKTKGKLRKSIYGGIYDIYHSLSVNLVIITAQGYRKQLFLLNHALKQLIINNQLLLDIG